MNKAIPLIAAGLLILAASVRAQLPIDGVHYPIGLEGIKSGSLPGPGIHFRDDSYFYTGTSDWLPDFSTLMYVQSPRLTWMTDWKILGADYGLDVMVPLVYKEASYNHLAFLPSGRQIVESTSDNHFGPGDVKIEPLLLSWHLNQFDFMAGYALWMPTGDYNNSSVASLGDGCWTHMMTLGGGWFPDPHKDWAISVLNHFEFNSQVPGIGTRSFGGHFFTFTENVPCSTYSLEWGISRTICDGIDFGLVGYYQRQFTDQTEATVAFRDADVAGIGPEIRAQIPRWGLSGALRYDYEFLADRRPQGHTIDFTLTKQFF